MKVYQDSRPSNTPLSDMLHPFAEAMFPEFRMEADAAYFTSNCSDLSANETMAVKQEFANLLNAHEVCMKGKSSLEQIPSDTMWDVIRIVTLLWKLFLQSVLVTLGLHEISK